MYTSLQSTNVVYNFICDVQNCKAEFIGLTRLTLEKKLQSYHIILIENTSILVKEQNYKNLIIKVSIYILKHSARINT